MIVPCTLVIRPDGKMTCGDGEDGGMPTGAGAKGAVGGTDADGVEGKGRLEAGGSGGRTGMLAGGGAGFAAWLCNGTRTSRPHPLQGTTRPAPSGSTAIR
jgi:hypothetical protein